MYFKCSILMHVPFIFSKAGVVETTPTTLVTTPLLGVILEHISKSTEGLEICCTYTNDGPVNGTDQVIFGKIRFDSHSLLS